MGFLSLGGQIVHTSVLGYTTPSITGSIGLTGSSGVVSISGTNSSITTSTTSTTSTSSPYLVYGGSTMNYTIQKSTYHILGEDVEVDGYVDGNILIAISTLNILGKPFYDELKKNKISFPKEIENYLELKFKILERDRKINEVLK